GADRSLRVTRFSVTSVSPVDELVAGIRSTIESAATRPPTPDRKFNKDDEFVAYGLNVPAWRRIMREFRPQLRALPLNERLDLVRKGVGWALKDLMRGDRERVLEYVKELRRRGVSSTVTLYAIRDLDGRERQEVLAVRPNRTAV